MSIEQDIARMADALEKVATFLTALPGASLSGQVGVKTPNPMPVRASVQAPAQTAEDLKRIAQSMAGKFPGDTTQIMNFTNYVRNFVCARFGVKKLIEITAADIPEAAGLLNQFDPAQNYSPTQAS